MSVRAFGYPKLLGYTRKILVMSRASSCCAPRFGKEIGTPYKMANERTESV